MLRQKILLIFLSVLCTVIVVEGALRVAGMIFLAAQSFKNRPSLSPDQFIRIMCIGESTTAQGGENSYPSQLEKILNATSSGKKFKVINKGIPGQTSEYILEHVEQWLDEYQPHILVTMMGINDRAQWVLDDGPLLRFFKNMRVYKLERWFKESFRNRQKRNDSLPEENFFVFQTQRLSNPDLAALLFQGVSLRDMGRYDEADRLFKELISADFGESYSVRVHREYGESLKLQGKYKELVGVVKYLLDIDMKDNGAKDWLNFLCQEQDGKSEALNFLKALREQSPHRPIPCKYLGVCYFLAGDPRTAQEYFSKAEELALKGFNPGKKEKFLLLSVILKRRNIGGVFVQYPTLNVQKLKNLLRESPAYDEFYFVDNERLFKEAIASVSYEDIFSDRFGSSFGHCTTRGNQILAQNVAKTIRQVVDGLSVNERLSSYFFKID